MPVQEPAKNGKEQKGIPLDGLESVLSKEAFRLLGRLRAHFKINDIEYSVNHCDYTSVGKILASLALLTDHQDAIFDLVERSEKVGGGFMPLNPAALLYSAEATVQLAMDRNRVLALFEDLAELGYDEKEYQKTSGHATLRAFRGVINVSKRRREAIATLKELRRFMGLPGLYEIENQNLFNFDDGLFFNSEGFLRSIDLLPDIRFAERTFHTLEGAKECGQHILYKPDTFAEIGRNAAAVRRYQELVRDKVCAPNLGLSPSIVLLATDPHVMNVLSILTEYKSRDWNPKIPGIELSHYASGNCSLDDAMSRAKNLKQLAREVPLKNWLYLGVACREFNVLFKMRDLVEDVDAGRKILSSAPKLFELVQEVKPYLSAGSTNCVSEERVSRESVPMNDYADKIVKATGHKSQSIELMDALCKRGKFVAVNTLYELCNGIANFQDVAEGRVISSERVISNINPRRFHDSRMYDLNELVRALRASFGLNEITHNKEFAGAWNGY